MKLVRNLMIVALSCVAVLGAANKARSDDVIYINENSYAAIAYSPKTGEFGVAYNYGSRWSAQQEALKLVKADDAKIVCWVNNGFCALALGDDKGCYGVGWSWGDGASTREARQYAIDNCNERTTNARIVILACSSDAMKPIIKK